jgi:hypothetical protein
MRLHHLFLSAVFVTGAIAIGGAVCLSAEERDPVDRILAVVDDDPILASEVDQILAFGIVKPEPDEDERDTHRRALDFLIEERLRFHEVDRFGFAEVPIDVVDGEFARLQQRLGGPVKFDKVLTELGLDEQGARQLLARQIMIWIYVEERLGARIFVSLDDIRQYYDEELVPQLAERGSEVPPMSEVREPIRSLLREQRMNEELERWTAELVQAADVDDYFNSAFDSLPPNRITLDEAGSS